MNNINKDMKYCLYLVLMAVSMIVCVIPFVDLFGIKTIWVNDSPGRVIFDLAISISGMHTFYVANKSLTTKKPKP